MALGQKRRILVSFHSCSLPSNWPLGFEIIPDEICFSAFKQVVIVGNGGVGKSSMIQRYCKGIYTKDYKKTIGVDFLERQIEWVYEMHFLEIDVNWIESSTICMWLICVEFRLQNWWRRHPCNVVGYSWYVANIHYSFANCRCIRIAASHSTNFISFLISQVKKSLMQLPKLITVAPRHAFWRLAQPIECHSKQSKNGRWR